MILPAHVALLVEYEARHMFDRDIRPTLLRVIRTDHPSAAVFEEFPVCRKGRADLVAVNASLWGYEIKSARDTLNRLPLQVELYDCIFDFCVIVAAECHLRFAERIIPQHWGIFSVSGSTALCEVIETRKPQQNPNRQVEQIIRLLWKNEALKTLRTHGVPVPRNAPVRLVWEILSQLPLHELEESVRSALKSRQAIEAAE